MCRYAETMIKGYLLVVCMCIVQLTSGQTAAPVAFQLSNMGYSAALTMGYAHFSPASITLNEENHRLSTRMYGGVKMGCYYAHALADKIYIVPQLNFHFQKLRLNYEIDGRIEYWQEIYPVTLEIPVHFNFVHQTNQQNIVTLFGAKWTYNMFPDELDSRMRLQNSFLSFDLGLGKSFLLKETHILPFFIYSLGAENVFQYSDLPIHEQAFSQILMHQFSIHLRWN